LVCIVTISLCICLKNINAETLDDEKDFILEASDLPVQISFYHYAYVSTWFIIVFAFALLPQQLLIQYIGRHEKSPPRIPPVISF